MKHVKNVRFPTTTASTLVTVGTKDRVNNSQPFTIQGTFKNGTVVFVLTFHNGDASWRSVGTAKDDGEKIRVTDKIVGGNVPMTATIEGRTWVWSIYESDAGNTMRSVLYFSEEDKGDKDGCRGEGYDRDGDVWDVEGKMNKNGQVHLKDTYKDKKDI